MASIGGEVEIWGDGKKTRSFLYIDECLEGTLRLMRSDFTGPVNIGSDEMVRIDQLVDIVAEIAGKSVKKRHIDGPTGVRGRNSDNRAHPREAQQRPGAAQCAKRRRGATNLSDRFKAKELERSPVNTGESGQDGPARR